MMDYSIQRIVENMSSQRLFLNPTSRMPDIPNMNHTLLFIETNRYIPISSNLNLEQRIPEQWESFLDSDISIDLPLRQPNTPQQTAGSTSNLKKKKNGCICRKTKCLKMYCECFSTGKTCTEDCSCHDCSNDHNHTTQIMKTYQTLRGKTSTTTKHTHGCNCKKSQCRKKYCECFNAGLACGNDCKCEDCANRSSQDHPHHSSRAINLLNNPENTVNPQLST